MRIVGVIEARMGSSRLPGKMLYPFAGRPLLEHVVRRAQACRTLSAVVVATTTAPLDSALERWARSLGAACYRGSEDDVLSRVLEAARSVGGDVIVKLSGDNPFYHPEYVDPIVDAYGAGKAEFLTNTAMGFTAKWSEARSWPVGTGVNVFSTRLLAGCLNKPLSQADREHVIKYFIDHPEEYRLAGFHAVGALAQFRRPELRFCLDTGEDFRFLGAIFDELTPSDPMFGLSAVLRLIDRRPDLLSIVANVAQKAL